MGTLVSCPPDREASCLWVGGANNQVVDSQTLRNRMLAANGVAEQDAATALRNLQTHMTYIESKLVFAMPNCPGERCEARPS